MRVSAIQLQSGPDREQNHAEVRRLCAMAMTGETPELLVLPEVFAFQGGSLPARRDAAEAIPDGPSSRLLRELAITHRVAVHGGSFLERDPESGALFNTSVVYGPDGSLLARYRKLHLFDVALPDGTVFRESDLMRRGTEVVTFALGATTVGCTICYDLRFGELFRQLAARGARVIVVPAAFTALTGHAHWEILLRARAIETQCFVIAAAQTGEFPTPGGNRRNWGHSMIIDPWGTVLASLEDGSAAVSATLDLARAETVRRQIPVHDHRVLPG